MYINNKFTFEKQTKAVKSLMTAPIFVVKLLFSYQSCAWNVCQPIGMCPVITLDLFDSWIPSFCFRKL